MTAPTPPTLEVRDLTKTFASTDPPTEVLGGIDMSVSAGEFLAVMGASGSGKSTLLYCASGMDRPTSGTVLLEGRELTAMSEAAMSRTRLTRMGFVFQQAHFLDNLSIRENVLLPALKAAPSDGPAVRARVAALMDRFGIAHVAAHGVTEVSGGQLQRAAICRALATDPAIVFADEPTGALNSSMTTEVMDALGDAHRRGAALVLVTHDPGCAARAERVMYLRDGCAVDSYALGAWSEDQMPEREGRLLSWLRALGF